jgi:tRNA-2-methylthio-N6-dimethylallyladenosine synthase
MIRHRPTISQVSDALGSSTGNQPTLRSYHILTWGCRMNEHDSEKLAGSLEACGYSGAEDIEEAGLILLNTCSIREKAAEKVFSELGRLKQLKSIRPGLLIGVCGCVAQQEGEQIFSRAPYVDFVMGPRAIGSLPATLAKLESGERFDNLPVDVGFRNDSILFPTATIKRKGLETGKALITIIEGCNHRCSFCVVPSTRGREIYRDMNAILDEVRGLTEIGILEVEFLGQTVNAYRDAQGNNLGDLLKATATVDGVERIRFTTSHPAQMTERLIEAMAETGPKLCPFLHLPVQSGSSAVLSAMKRGYDRERYIRTIEQLRAKLPGMLFGTDLIVGFPTETEEDFKQTLSLLDEVRYDMAYSFMYSERPGTTALELGDPVSEGEKSERLHRLLAHQKVIQEEQNQLWLGQEVEVLVEGLSKRDPGKWSGRTPENKIVNYYTETGCCGRLESVKIINTTAYSLQGESLAGDA